MENNFYLNYPENITIPEATNKMIEMGI